MEINKLNQLIYKISNMTQFRYRRILTSQKSFNVAQQINAEWEENLEK